MDCQEYREMIAAHVDGALSPSERLAAQSHLERCRPCQQKFLWETEVKGALKPKLSVLLAGPGLRERLLKQLEKSPTHGFSSWFYMPYRLAAAFALLLLFTVPYFVWRDKVREDIFTDAIAQYQKAAQGIGDTPQPASSLTPAARLLDLSPWGYRVLARQTQEARGREERVFIYQGQEKEYLLAQEFEGLDISPPPKARIIRASSREFVTYSQEGVNLVAWKEKDKDLLCILASTVPQQKLLSLAREITAGS